MKRYDTWDTLTALVMAAVFVAAVLWLAGLPFYQIG